MNGFYAPIYKDFVDEVNFLYNWWLIRSKQQRTLGQDAEDNLMFIRLAKIRESL